MLDKNGMPITEEVEIKIPAFRVVLVFDVSQTDGKELPDIGGSMGVVRTTYLIDEHGVIIRANDKVKAADDPKNMLKELD